MSFHNRKLNWVPQLKTHDHEFHVPKLIKSALGPVDLRPVCPPVSDQGQEGSCTANAVGGVFEIKQKIEGFDHGPISRQALYHWALKEQGTPGVDAGSTISMVMRIALEWGLPLEALWPYSKGFAAEPTPDVIADGAKRKPNAKMEAHVHQDLNHIWAMLAAKDAIAFGFNVPDYFMTQKMADTGIMDMPTRRTKYVGGHAVAIVGYDPSTHYFLVRNSWGQGWGLRGYFKMPEAFLLGRACSDFMGVVDAPKVA